MKPRNAGSTPVSGRKKTDANARKPTKLENGEPMKRSMPLERPYRLNLYLQQLKRDQTIDLTWENHENAEWKEERKYLLRYNEMLIAQSSYMPRKGELVLWTEDDGEIRWDVDTQEFFVDTPRGRRHPKWQAGVVSDAPNEPIALADLYGPKRGLTTIKRPDFKIDSIPDPNSKDKSVSKQSRHVSIHRIRPLFMFREVMSGINANTWHDSIGHAMCWATTVSLVEPLHIHGTWPKLKEGQRQAEVSYAGIWIGSEYIVPGDIVTLLPEQIWDSMTTIMVVYDISQLNCKLGYPGETAHVSVIGKTYTTEKNLGYSGKGVRILGYDNLYPLLPWGEFSSWPIGRIGYRLPERSAMEITLRAADFDIGVYGMMKMRQHAITNFGKLNADGPNKGWRIVESRAYGLGIEEIGGQPCGAGIDRMEVREWQRHDPSTVNMHHRHSDATVHSQETSEVQSSHATDLAGHAPVSESYTHEDDEVNGDKDMLGDENSDMYVRNGLPTIDDVISELDSATKGVMEGFLNETDEEHQDQDMEGGTDD